VIAATTVSPYEVIQHVGVTWPTDFRRSTAVFSRYRFVAVVLRS